MYQSILANGAAVFVGATENAREYGEGVARANLNGASAWERLISSSDFHLYGSYYSLQSVRAGRWRRLSFSLRNSKSCVFKQVIAGLRND